MATNRTSTKKERLQAYLDAGDVDLTEDDIAAIEKAGAKGPPGGSFLRFWAKMAVIVAIQLGAQAAVKALWNAK